MRFRDLPPVYARLAGFLLGACAHRDGEYTLLAQPLGWLAEQGPQPLREGFRLAIEDPPGGEPPVLLVPGFLGPGFLLQPLAWFLRAHGRRVDLLSTFPALSGVEAVAKRIAEAIARLKEETGAAKVDVVAHSMGGLATRYYMHHLMPEPSVRRFVSIAVPHAGTELAHFPFTQSARDMRPQSEFLRAIAEIPPAPGVRCVTIRAAWDQIVWPREHGRWEAHAEDHELPFSEHWAVQLDLRTLALVLTLLEEAEGDMDETIQSSAGQATS